jgi:hypothetical protein
VDRAAKASMILPAALTITFSNEAKTMYPSIPTSSTRSLDEYVALGGFGGRPEAADAVRRARPYRCPKPAITGASRSRFCWWTICGICTSRRVSYPYVWWSSVSLRRRARIAKRQAERHSRRPRMFA